MFLSKLVSKQTSCMRKIVTDLELLSDQSVSIWTDSVLIMKVSILVLIISSFTISSSQQIAKRKCLEYSSLAKQNGDSSPWCKVQDDKSSGVPIEPYQFPATALLGYTTSETEIRYTCDATLISEDTLIAAGHCLQPPYGRPTWARIGATYTTLGVEVEVKESLCHPHYYPVGRRGIDVGVALIKLKQRLNSSFVPACLDTEGITTGAVGVGVGRPIGLAYEELWEKCPMKSWLEVKSSKACTKSSEATLCTKDPANGPGDCLSGPLYVFKERCVLSVAGISSFGRVCYKDEVKTPSVYTKVAYYVPWIESIAWPST